MSSTTDSRDFDARPYSPDERRVADYLQQIMPDIGTGDDPVGFLISSHTALMDRLAHRNDTND